MSEGPPDVVRCVFCQRNKAHVRYLVHGNGKHLCDDCILASVALLRKTGVVRFWELIRVWFG